VNELKQSLPWPFGEFVGTLGAIALLLLAAVIFTAMAADAWLRSKAQDRLDDGADPIRTAHRSREHRAVCACFFVVVAMGLIASSLIMAAVLSFA